jgi:hypothetical protein
VAGVIDDEVYGGEEAGGAGRENPAVVGEAASAYGFGLCNLSERLKDYAVSR